MSGAPRRRFLKGQAAAFTPPQAKAFYRHPRWRAFDPARALAATIDGSPFQLALLDRVFGDTLGRFRWRREDRDVWANWTQKARLVAGKWVRLWLGDCDDFAILLLVALTKAGLPRGALRLCRCELRGRPSRDVAAQRAAGRDEAALRLGHLVLAVMTARGTLILDNRQQRPLWADDQAFRDYDFLGMEDPPAEAGAPARWVWLRPMTLHELARRVQEGRVER